MKLWVFSDLHLDVNRHHPFELRDPRPEHDVVVIAGDLCEGIDNGVRRPSPSSSALTRPHAQPQRMQGQ